MRHPYFLLTIAAAIFAIPAIANAEPITTAILATVGITGTAAQIGSAIIGIAFTHDLSIIRKAA